MSFRKSLVRLAALLAIVIAAYSATACGTSGHPLAKPIYAFIEPHSAVAYSNSNLDRIVFSLSVEYNDGHHEAMTSGVDWVQVDGFWATFDSASRTGVCHYPAPQNPLFGPEPATFKATVTVDGQSFNDTASLYCF